MNNETVEQKPLTKHIQTAVNAIEKEIDRKANQALKLGLKAQDANRQADALREEMKGLQEQIAKLKGE